MDVRIAAADNIVKRYTDTFTGNNVGPNWIYQTVRINANDSYNGGRITAGNFQIVHVGGANASSQITFWFPRVLTYPGGLWGSSQFVQATFISGVAQSRHGICVLGRLDDDSNNVTHPQQAYTLVNHKGVGLEAREVSMPAVTDTLLATVAELVANDVIRIEVVVNTPTQNTVNFFKNGVSINTTVDGLCQPQGFPGFWAESTDLTGTSQWNNFSCGPL